ncbi:universal stress protein [Leptolyngbya sp. FACHB-261]|uniref:universal stress protein n=1 Tax=Leptolyngbya sp. FACHB-261 TaxID=2692806 RepID=UPI001689AE76|nr:universal stress protein [Leptolyngbya sp. FACHB-261]MBD2103163.1 universal stress protein [Leptolyngbya sp. FACHB-261]
MFQKLLIATELSDGLDRLAQLVPSLAAGGIRELVFVCAIPWQEGQIPRPDQARLAFAQSRLAVAQEKAPPDCKVHLVIETGKPVDLIARAATEHQSQAIMLGTPMRTLLEERLFGSTTIGLSQRLRLPLIVMRPHLLSAFTLEELDLRCRHLFRHLLIPFDGSPPSQSLVKQIAERLKSGGRGSVETCTLFRVVDSGGRRGVLPTDAIAQAEQSLAPVQAELETLGLQVRTDARQGNPVLEILKISQEQDISALAVSSSRAGTVWELSVQSVCGELLRRSWHPVIFFSSKS